MKIGEIDVNRDELRKIIELQRKELLVPFVGAGFSMDFCPGWEDFLEKFFESVRHHCMADQDVKTFERLKNSEDENRYEAMAQLLAQSAEARLFKQEMIAAFNRDIVEEKKKKFFLLNKAFPRLKVTTNFDCLIENNFVRHVDVVRGNPPDSLKRALNPELESTLVKIHGCVRDESTIVLTHQQYNDYYGEGELIDKQKPLPVFLTNLFTTRHVLFIGCSLKKDRWLALMERKRGMPSHYAIVKRKRDKDSQKEFTKFLSRHMITPIWIDEYSQIEKILQLFTLERDEFRAPDHGTKFVGREKHLEEMETLINGTVHKKRGQFLSGQLAVIHGAGGIGKTTLAIEASRRYATLGRYPDGIIGPIRVDEYSPQSFAVYLAHLFGHSYDEPLEYRSAKYLINCLLNNKQALIILDNAINWDSLQYMIPDRTRCTIFLTTRNRDLFKRIRHRFREFDVLSFHLDIFTKKESLQLFREMLGEEHNDSDVEVYLDISSKLGFLPIAIRQSICLILYGPHYSAEQLRDKLSGAQCLEILDKGQKLDNAEDNRPIEAIFNLSSTLLTSDHIRTLKYMAVCAPGPIPLDFLIELTEDPDIQERLERLYTLYWCQRCDSLSRRSYKLHQLVRELIKRRFNNNFAPKFLKFVHSTFHSKDIPFSQKDALVPQLEEAFRLAQLLKDDCIKDWIHCLFEFCRYRGHGDFFIRLCCAAVEIFQDDLRLLPIIYRNQALILMDWGRLQEAMELLKKEEELKKDLGNIAELGSCYGNQAQILQAWGHQTEAMTLYEKEEAIKREFDNVAGLARTYGNQALVMRNWGYLKKAMDLHKEEERIHSKLGNKAGLASCYGNQALILHFWGRTEEAMELLRQEKEIYTELGNQAGLAKNDGNMALIHAACGNFKAAMALHKKEETIKKSLTLKAELANCYGNQALIYFEWGQFEVALNLHMEEQELDKELNNSLGLSRSLWNQGRIYWKWCIGELALSLWQESIALKNKMGIPTVKNELIIKELNLSDNKSSIPFGEFRPN